ncbi:MAG: LPS-assembly protein LptD, partial [Treponemataceae bacterium]|nr:LPS-assembly protein LptD [Treponemataceae bacterium]
MSYTYGYDFDEATGWVQRAEQDFLPYSLSLSFAPGTKTIYTWKNRVSMGLGLSTGIVADLLRPTNSYFTFSPSVSFKVHEFLSFTFSATSRNSVIYRYFGNEIGINGETNIFKDLLNSFRFDDEELRKNSGFKLKSLNFELTHEMHDWDFKTTFKIEPRLKTDVGSGRQPYYDFSPYVTISIVWRPMSAMKTEIIDNYGEWRLTP